MPVLLIRHQVADYETWIRVFLEDEVIRRANGCGDAAYFHSASDPDEIWILLQWDDVFRARLYIRSDEWREAIVRAGVIDRPDCWYLKEGDPPNPES